MKLLVHLHVYYHDQLDWFLEQLSHIDGCPWDLTVTWSGEHPQSEATVRAFRPNARILPVNNVGYDIWPFLYVLQNTDLTAYDAVLKLHTKNADARTNKINGLKLSGTQWRDCLVLPLLESPKQFRRVLRQMETHPRCGMVCSGFMIRQPSRYLAEDSVELEKEMRRIGLECSDRRFCAGAMFLARAVALLPLQKIALSEADFEAGSSHSVGTLAHTYERILSIVVSAGGYTLVPADYRRISFAFWRIGRGIGALLKNIFALNHSKIDGKKYLTLFGFTFPLSAGKEDRAHSRLSTRMNILLYGHLLNPLWHSRSERRARRGAVIQKAVRRYLDKHFDFSQPLKDEPASDSCRSVNAPVSAPEKIWTLWLQGEAQMPPVVRACIRSMRENSGLEVVVLDETKLRDFITLPAYIQEKWEKGLIRPAHYADICRIELLYRYGGLWCDATDFIPKAIPGELMQEDFFVFLSGEKLFGAYSFIQNCFIRARRGSYLLAAWRRAIFAYWEKEDSAIEYFIHQMLFKKVVEEDPEAAQAFARMPHIAQDTTHELWFRHGKDPFDPTLYAQIVENAPFQKTEYKSRLSQEPPRGSFAEQLLRL